MNNLYYIYKIDEFTALFFEIYELQFYQYIDN